MKENTEEKKEKKNIFNKINLEDKLKEENIELRNDLQRTRADFENYRKNVENRISDAQFLGEKKAILALLPLIDNIERAISYLPEDLSENKWAQNVVKMSNDIEKNLSKIGVKKIESSKGSLFNPEIHNAIQIDEDADGDEEIISEELQSGYEIKGDVLRAAMVKVGRK